MYTLNYNKSFFINNVCITSNIADLFQKAYQYFYPYYQVTKNNNADVKFEFAICKITETEYKNILAKLKMEDCCLKDFLFLGQKHSSESYLNAYYKYDNHYEIYFLKEINIIFFIHPDHIKILGTSKKALFKIFRRYIRMKILYKDYIDKKYIPLHCSCVEKNGQCLAFLGESGAGKTSASLPLISYRQYNLVASDLVFYDVKNNMIYGTPERVRISPGTLKAYGDKYQFLIKEHQKDKTHLSPQFFSIIYNCSIIPSAKLKNFIVPQINLALNSNIITTNETKSLKEFVSHFFPISELETIKNLNIVKNVIKLDFNGNVNELINLYDKHQELLL